MKSTDAVLSAIRLPAAFAAQGKPDEALLNLRRIYILPTRFGVAFALTLLMMLLGSINYANALGFVLTFLLGSLALVSMLHTCRNLSGLRVRTGRVRPVFAGEKALFRLCLDNRDGAQRSGVCVRFRPKIQARAKPRGVVHTTVPAGQVHVVELPVMTGERGRAELGRVSLATRYPFGLLRAWCHVDLPISCIVYPTPAGRPELPPSTATARRDGGRHGREQDDFAGFRDYRPGDSTRRIYWKAAARGQGLLVKQFAGAGATELELHWNDTAGDVEARLSQLCLWALEAETEGHRYGLELPGTKIPTDRGESHLSRCLEALARYGEPDA